MAKKQYLDLAGLTAYDAEIKAHIASIAEDNVCYVTVIPNEDMTGGAADKTMSQLEEAYNEGKVLFCKLIMDGGNVLMPLYGEAFSDDLVMFGSLVNTEYAMIVISSEGVVIEVVSLAQADQIPTSTSWLENDSGYITQTVSNLTNYYNKSTVDSKDSTTLASAKSYTDTAVSGKANSSHTHDDRYYTESEIDSKLSGKANSSHTHNYAGSSSAGGAATSANKINTDAGSVVQPVYFEDGIPKATTYTLNKSVPSDAVFTDTVYTLPVATSSVLGGVKSGGDVAISSTGVITVNDDSHNHTIANVDNLQDTLNAKVPTSRTVNGKALSGNITLSASDVGADASGSADSALISANAYTDGEISKLVNNASTETLDSIAELADAIEENDTAIEALNSIAASKASSSDLTAHTGNKSNPHEVTKAQVGLGNVENKSSAAIREELTKTNVTDALGYTPPTTNTTYSVVSTTADGLAPKRTGTTTKFLRDDGSWAVPPDTKYTHPSYTARTGKPTANQTPGFGGTATVSQITSDATGHVTAATDRTITIPSTLSNGTGTAGLIKTSSTVTSNSGYTACPVISGVPYYKDTNTVYTHPSYTARTGVPTADATLTFGGTFNVSQPVSDATGHITAINSRTYTMPSDRLFTTLVPTGTAIPENADLNTVTYMKVGRYFCSANTTVKTLKNCPTTTYNSSGAGTAGVAFMMEVYSPLATTIDNETTKTWIYRLRKLTAYTGEQYIQYCYVNGTANNWIYGTWKQIPTNQDLRVGGVTNSTGKLDHFAGSTTAAGTAAKVAGFWNNHGFTLATGSRVTVQFTNANTAASPTLNVAGTGAKAIQWRGAALPSSQYWAAGAVLDFVYDGGSWELIGVANDNNTTYSAATSSALGLVKIGSNITVSSGTISLTKANVTAALGYTPPTSDTNTTYSQATSSTLGLVKIGYTESGKNYPVELNSSGQMYVNVPWTDNNTTYSAGTGISISSNKISLASTYAGGTAVTLNGASKAASTASFYAPTGLSGDTYFLAGGSSAPTWKPRNQVTATLYNMTTEKSLTFVADASNSNALYLRAGGTSSAEDLDIRLGSSTARWHTVYSKAGDFSGAMSIDGAVTTGSTITSGSTIISKGAVRPNSNNSYACGTTDYRWSSVNGVNGNLSGTLSVTGITTVASRIQPNSDNAVNCGYSSAKWMNVYCKNSANTTSDLNEKKDLKEIDDRYIELFDLVQPYTYMFKNGDRVHTGFISQYVEEAMTKVGLTAEEVGFFCKDVKTEAIFDEEGNFVEDKPVYDKDGNLTYSYALRYGEYIAIMTEKIKRMEYEYQIKIDNLESRLAKLEGDI